MKSLLRVPIFSILSLMLLIAAIVLWGRSRRHVDMVGLFSPAGHLQGFASQHGGILLFASDIPFGSEMGLTARTISVSPDEFADWHEALFDPIRRKVHVLGFRVASGRLDLTSAVIVHYNALIVPWWFLVLVLAPLPLRMGRALFVRMRRWRRGQCLSCGYDIRASAERCPECGAAIRAQKRAAMADASAVTA